MLNYLMPYICNVRYLIYIIGVFSRLNAAAFCRVFRHRVGCKVFMNAYFLVLLPMAFVVVLVPAALGILFGFFSSRMEHETKNFIWFALLMSSPHFFFL